MKLPAVDLSPFILIPLCFLYCEEFHSFLVYHFRSVSAKGRIATNRDGLILLHARAP